MNVYDFDGTIYRGDCSIDLFIYSLIRQPWIIFLLPKQIFYIIAYKLKFCSKEKAKSSFFSFLHWIRCDSSYLEKFWNSHIQKIEPWYIHQQQIDDVVISASPEFLLAPVCKRIGIKHLIASEVDSGNGQFVGANCCGEEKCKRFRERFPNQTINSFYSDSLSDSPMMRLAQKAYLVQTDNIILVSNDDNSI